VTLPRGLRVAWGEVADAASRREVSRTLLSGLLREATFVSRCPRCGGEHGRIRVSGAEAAVSVSYAGGWAVAVVAEGCARAGIDVVEADAGGLDRVLPGADARAWARVEAVLKADGRGLDVDPARVQVTGGVNNAWRARIDRGAWVTGYDLIAPAGLVAAVVVSA
jgi:4'-phosphopantetheinyl transferase